MSFGRLAETQAEKEAMAMDVVKIDDISRERARELYQEYKTHRHYATPVDDEIRKAYREIARGGVVIKALESIASAGLGADGLPRLAIGRADLTHIHCRLSNDGSGVFASEATMHRSNAAKSLRIAMPPGSFKGAGHIWRARAVMPLIPIHLRPRHALENYHVLWEAEWQPIPPRDPYLLRRIGDGDLWLVLAAWDLTEVERAAMASRINLTN